MSRKLEDTIIENNKNVLATFYRSKCRMNLPTSSNEYTGPYDEKCHVSVRIETSKGDIWKNESCIMGVAVVSEYDDYKVGFFYHGENDERIWVGGLRFREFSINFNKFSYTNNCLNITAIQNDVNVYVSAI